MIGEDRQLRPLKGTTQQAVTKFLSMIILA